VDVITAYAPAATALAAMGLLIQRQRVGPPVVAAPGQRPTLATAHVLLWAYLATVLLCCAPAVGFIISTEPFVPDSRELFPLPAGLTVLSNQDNGCGSGSCSRAITIGTTTGLTASQIKQRLREHLRNAHGWRLDPHDSACRQQGWLVDHTTVCVEIYTDQAQHVVVDLTGGRAG
jgi:hypothetical protein